MPKLFVSGFPLDSSELQLAQLIAPHGDISTMKIVRDRKTRICKGYAFVEMHSAQDAVNVAAALDGLLMGDRQLTVNLVAEEPAAVPSSSFKQSRPAMTRPDRIKRPRKQV